ncbi:hypothetical protein ACFL4R_01710 [Nitrospirota bacterium]
MTREKWQETFQSLIEYIREAHKQEIDTAYDYFWEEEDPEEILGGTALIMGFHNFEDWMACDYMNPETKKTFIDTYIESKSPSGPELDILKVMKDSFVSLFEVTSAGDESVVLNDIATGRDLTINDKRLCALSKGDMFGSRLLELEGGPILTNAIYPFGGRFKEHVMKHLNAMYGRFEKHCEGKSCMEDFLRQETYTINTVWVTCLFKAK